MEITNFVTENFLSSFAGTLMAVELMVFTTKNFPIIKKIPTKLYTVILAVIHIVIVQIVIGKADITVEFVYILFINSLIVELILCGGYDTLIDKFKSVTETLNKAEEDIAEINGVISNETTTNNADANNTTSENDEEDMFSPIQTYIHYAHVKPHYMAPDFPYHATHPPYHGNSPHRILRGLHTTSHISSSLSLFYLLPGCTHSLVPFPRRVQTGTTYH